MEGTKIYGLCIERLKHQINIAKHRTEKEGLQSDRYLLESYNTGELDDIIDILELYDIEDRTFEVVHEKLEELAYTVSVLTRETLAFGYTQNGHLGLYLALAVEKENAPEYAYGGHAVAA
jgi:hypothetical protein